MFYKTKLRVILGRKKNEMQRLKLKPWQNTNFKNIEKKNWYFNFEFNYTYQMNFYYEYVKSWDWY